MDIKNAEKRERGNAATRERDDSSVEIGMAETSMEMNGQQVVERIGFAERWLDRAKRQCEGGDMPRGLLDLFLANAEVTHALRMAHETRPSRRRRLMSGCAVATACLLVMVALSAGVPGKFTGANFWGGRWQVSLPASASSADVPIIVTFDHQPGALLGLVESPSSQVSVAAKRVEQHIAPARIRSAASVRRRPVVAKRSAPAMPAAPAIRARSAPQATPPARPTGIVSPVTPVSSEQTSSAPAPIPSDVELINLVLTAERTLRTQSRP